MLRFFWTSCFLFLTLASKPKECGASTSNIIRVIGRNYYLTGKYNPADYPQYFSVVPKEYSNKTIYMRSDALAAFVKMAKAAKRSGFADIIILSGLRDYKHQKRIWESKYQQFARSKNPSAKERFRQTISFSAIPGLSRHHWGTDVDIVSLENSYFTNGEGNALFQWLQKNAKRYGFYLVYTPGRIGGHDVEMWHYTYKPASRYVLSLLTTLKASDISGFKGEENIQDFHSFLMTYMFDINPELLR